MNADTTEGRTYGTLLTTTRDRKMPFKSQKQRSYFWKAKSDPKFRKAQGLNFSAVQDMISHDTGGKLPKRMKGTK